MTLDAIGELNWLAVLVAGVAYFALGAIWYQPMVLGRIWMRASAYHVIGLVIVAMIVSVWF